MKWLIAIITAVIQALLPWVAKQSQPTAEDATKQPQLRDRLRKRIRDRWKAGVLLLGLSCVAAGVAGCGTRTVYVAPGEPVRLRETVRNAKVWVLDADGQPVAGRMDLPNGWWCLPDEEE